MKYFINAAAGRRRETFRTRNAILRQLHPAQFHKALCLWAAVAVALAGTGCSKEDVPPLRTGEPVALHLSATIDGNAAAGNLPETVTKAPVIGTGFPVSGGGTVSNIGLFLMQSNKTTPYETGSDNLLAELTGKTGPVYSWRYQYSGATAWMSHLRFKVGETLSLWGYYPRQTSGVSATSVPFDLSTAAQQGNQSDLLWCPPQTLTVTNGDATKNVSLSFRHAYVLLEFFVKKSDTTPATVTGVQVSNAAGKSWIKNKGTMNPQTGAIGSATAGTVAITCSKAVSSSDYTSFQVMVPPFSGAFADGDVEVQFYIGGEAKPQKFTLQKSYLSGSGSTLGMTQGLKYSFKLLYQTYGEGSLTVQPWDTGGADGIVGDNPPIGNVKVTDWDTAGADGIVGENPPIGDIQSADWGTNVATGSIGGY